MQKSHTTKKNKKDSWDSFAIIILIIIIFDLQLFGIFGRTTHFIDYPIIFEGGYRIVSSQIPFHDFYIPLGPIPFLIQGFFQLLFGSNIFAMATQGFFLSVILCVIFYYFLRKEFKIVLSFIFALFFYLSYQGLVFQPWYDYTAYFFFFINIFLLFKYYDQKYPPWFVYALSALLATLAFYSKQDVGLLQIIFILSYFIFNYHKKLKSIFIFFILPLIILTGGTYILFSNFTDFQYWFNLGQYPHSSQFSNFFSDPMKILNIVTSWKLYISLFFTYKILSNKIQNKNVNSTKLMYLFIIVAITPLITQVTSGRHTQTLALGIPFLVFMLYLLVKNDIKDLMKKHKRVLSLIIIFFILLTINPFPTYGLATLNYINPTLGRINEGCYSGALLSQTALEGLVTIREHIEENENDFISFTGYQFLYCDYNIDPPKKLPLWFDYEKTYFNEDIERIAEVINSSSPKVILFQIHHDITNRELSERFENIFYEMGYAKTEVVDAMLSSPISIFVKEKTK